MSELDPRARARDRGGPEPDPDAAFRDQLADVEDAQVEEAERIPPAVCGATNGNAIDPTVARDRERAAADRASAALHRAAAVRDREQAARDRRLAALDRAQAAAELAAAGVDDLTGALRRGVGLTSLEREVARAHRTNEALVVAFVDVDGLKLVNDTLGHPAGDRLLKRTVDLLKAHLRPYDVTVRMGGDEFVCSLYGVTIDGVRARFGQVCADLAAGPGGGSISFGLAELRRGDSLDDLIGRADAALLAGRGIDGSRSRPVRKSAR